MNKKPNHIQPTLSAGAFPSVQGMWKQHQSDAAQSLLPTGAPYVDERLRGGITQAGLHEFFGGAKADSHAAAAFALLLA